MSVCDYCKGRPVLNAASWVSISAPEYVPCPRCGREWDGEAQTAAEREREQDERDGAASCPR